MWKRGTNIELMEVYEEPPITNIIRIQRMGLLGHVTRKWNTNETGSADRDIRKEKRGRPRKSGYKR